MAAAAPLALTALANAPALLSSADHIVGQVGKAGKIFTKAVGVGRGIFNTAKKGFSSLFGKRHHHSSRRPQINRPPPPIPLNSLERKT